MYIALILPFFFIKTYALIPERCKGIEAEQPKTQETKLPTTNNKTEKREINFNNKKALQKTLNTHRKDLYKHLLKNGIKKENAKKVFELNFLEKPISSAKSQPEVIMTIDLYTSKFLKHEFVAKAFFYEHSQALNDAQHQYGVDKEIITALIAMESLAGYRKGDINILNALFTLAYTS